MFRLARGGLFFCLLASCCGLRQTARTEDADEGALDSGAWLGGGDRRVAAEKARRRSTRALPATSRGDLGSDHRFRRFSKLATGCEERGSIACARWPRALSRERAKRRYHDGHHGGS